MSRNGSRNEAGSATGCQDFRAAQKLSRRAALQVGGVSALGLGLPDLWRARALGQGGSGGPGFGTAKRCIFLFMWGGPSHLDTLDPKPNAPGEIRGEFQSIPTRVPGTHISEPFTRLAGLTDRTAVIRSLTHDDPAHLSSAHTTVTGHLPPVNKSDAEPPSDRDTPHIGSMMARLRPGSQTVPPFVLMPWKAYHPAAPGGVAPGQHGGWLGQRYDPFLVTGDPSRPDWEVPSLALLDGLSIGRLQDRKMLLQTLDAQRAALERQTESMTDLQQRAFRLLASGDVREAFDLNREPEQVRDRYGRNTHGQCVLLARRLIEHGVGLVSVNWHNDHKTFWDTHGNNFNRLKDDLIPPADQALSALLEDLQDRGLLEETLVVWVGEFGRKPQITKGNAGREHWPFCYSGLLAGGGIRGGTLYGASDKHGAYPATNPVTPHDLAATVYHALGVAPETTVKDRLDRPHPVYAGRPVEALFGV